MNWSPFKSDSQRNTCEPVQRETGAAKIYRTFFLQKVLRPEIVAIIEKATSIDIDERYDSVDDLAEDIRRFLREEAVITET